MPALALLSRLHRRFDTRDPLHNIKPLVGGATGAEVGTGKGVGDPVGELDGLEDGVRLGDSVGDPVGELDRLEDGVRLGDSVGDRSRSISPVFYVGGGRREEVARAIHRRRG